MSLFDPALFDSALFDAGEAPPEDPTPSVRAYGAATGGNAAGIAVAPPASHEAGDIVVLVAGTYANDVLAADNGFTKQYEAGKLHVWTRSAAGYSGNTIISGASNTVVGAAFVVRDSAGLGAEDTAYASGTGTVMSSAAFTTTAADELVVICAAQADNGALGAFAAGNLAAAGSFGALEIAGSDACLAVGHGSLAAAGSIGACSLTVNTTQAWNTCTFACAPLPPDPGVVPASTTIPTLAELVTGGAQQVLVTCSLYEGDAVLASPAVTGGSVTADSRRSILRDCSVEFAPQPGQSLEELYRMLVTPGVTIGLRRGFRLPGGGEVLADLGRFVPDEPQLTRDAAGMRLAVSATDVAIRVQRARWTAPYQILAGTALAEALTELLSDRYAQIKTQITASQCPEVMGAGLVTEAGAESDPWSDAVGLAAAYGYALYPDPAGVVTVRRLSLPTGGGYGFVFARGEAAILTELSRSSPLERTYNGVIASAEGSEVEMAVRGEAWDENPTSATYYLGPFGKAPYFYSSSLMTTADQCESAATALLAGLLGRVESLAFSSVVHPGLQPLDHIGIEQADGSVAGHVIDALTIPLDIGGAMTATCREIAVSW